MSATINTQGIGGDELKTEAFPKERGEQLENDNKLLKLYTRLLLGGVVASILLLSIDICRDNYLHSRITELERENAGCRIEMSKKENEINEKYFSIENDIADIKDEEEDLGQGGKEMTEKIESLDFILLCIKEKRYWEYEQCFK